LINLKEYSRVPFLEKGRSKKGWDCWGLAYVLYKEALNINLPLYLEDYTSTGQKDVIGTLITDQLAVMWEEVKAPNEFDIVNIRLRGRPMHIGVYLGKNRFIHALENSGTVIERVDSIMWQNRIEGFFKYVG